MKNLIIYIFILLAFINLSSLDLLNSSQPLFSAQNKVSDLVRSDIEDNTICPDSTSIWLWHDGLNIHLHWEVEIDHNFVNGQYTEEDKMPDADFLRVQIITNQLNPFSYGFYAFPLGNRYDNTRNENLSTDSDWDSHYQYCSTIEGNKWIVKMQIPFSDLRFSGKAPYKWKMIFTRYYESDESYYSYPYSSVKQGKDYFRLALPIQISDNLIREKNYTLKPYAIINYDLIEKKNDFDYTKSLGIDLSYKPLSSTMLKLSINPDFSDVPLDSATDTSNLKYAPTFSENRYFFTEDYNAFGIGSNLFYSRNILQPEYGFKGTYKSDYLSIGILSSKDKETITTKQGENDSLIVKITNPDDYYNIVSIRSEMNCFNTHLTVLNRIGENNNNEVYHFKSEFEFKQNYVFWADLNRSIYSENSINTIGYYASLGFDMNKGNFDLSANIRNMSSDFIATMGRINEKDFYSFEIDANQYFPINKKIIKSISTDIYSETKYKNDDTLMYRNLLGSSRINFQNKFSLGLNLLFEQENLNNKIHDIKYAEVEFFYKKFRMFSPRYLIRVAEILYFDRDKVYTYIFQRAAFYSRITNHIIISSYFDHSQYLNFEQASVYSETDTTTTYRFEDDRYWVGNIDASFNASNNVTLKIGYRYNGYTTISRTLNNADNEVIRERKYSADQGIYANLTLAVKMGIKIYLGYRSSFYEYNSKNVKDYDNLYIKLSYSY